MGLKSFIAKPYASWQVSQIRKYGKDALLWQTRILDHIIKKASSTRFGQEHQFNQIHHYQEFKQFVPLRGYEEFKPFIELIKKGHVDILWPGKPKYLAKTSGTTSGIKYIPISHDSISSHIETAKNALLCYINETGNSAFTEGKMIFLSGSPALEHVQGISTGRLSGIVNHHVPAYLTRNRLPSYSTNCIEDWEEKLDAIVAETINNDMRLISGIPPWMQMYFDRLIQRSGKSVGEIFPNFTLLVHGGVNISPYQTKLIESIGRKVDFLETYPASEGFFAFQDTQTEDGLLLNTWSGMFFEFVPVSSYFDESPIRLNLAEIEIGVNYALVISSNAGLWAYSIGDTVKFVSKDPYRIVVTGRVSHFISAFGEHVIGEEVEFALREACRQFRLAITEFTVAPQVSGIQGLRYHEWLIAFDDLPENMGAFAKVMDENLCRKNIYYDDLIRGNILSPLKIRVLPRDAFIQYMKNIGKLGGQNKVPRLSNDRNIAESILALFPDAPLIG